MCYINCNAPMRSHPLVRIVSGSFKDFYERYRQEAEEDDVGALSYKQFMKLLRKDRVWQRCLNSDYECRWCVAARNPGDPNHSGGKRHQKLNETQKLFYKKIKNSLFEHHIDTLMIQLDYAGIKIDNCKKVYELIIVRFVPDVQSKTFKNEVLHYLLPLKENKSKLIDEDDDPNVDDDEEESEEDPDNFLELVPKKDADYSLKCLRNYLKTVLRQQQSIRKIYIFTDGGRADFKNRKFLSGLLAFQQEINWNRDKHEEISVEHHVFAPNHGYGACDAAHSQGVQALKRDAFATRRIIDKLEYVKEVLENVKNHTVQIEYNDTRYPEPKPMQNITDCYKFTFDSDTETIFGSIDSEAEANLHEWEVGETSSRSNAKRKSRKMKVPPSNTKKNSKRKI